MSIRRSTRPVPPDVLEGEDCCLRALSLEDWALEQAMSRDPEVARWTYYPVDMTEQESRVRIQVTIERAGRGLVRRYAIVNREEEPVGTCGIGALDGDCPQISYAVLPQSRGRGIATSAARLLAQWALASGYATVSLETLDGNKASERVAGKAGFLPVERYQADHRGATASLTRWTATLDGNSLRAV
jgi:RimJ/RimL family protein N-acetyltransferase